MAAVGNGEIVVVGGRQRCDGLYRPYVVEVVIEQLDFVVLAVVDHHRVPVAVAVVSPSARSAFIGLRSVTVNFSLSGSST